MAASSLTSHPAFQSLQAKARALPGASIEQMFEDDPQRLQNFTASGAGLSLDFSKQLLDREARDLLLQLAEQCQWQEHIAALLDGESVNNTEARPALHSLLRGSNARALADKYTAVSSAQAQMREWAQRINGGELRGFSGQVITDVVNIGIGGSDLGPRLVTEALTPYQGAVACHYVANVDPSDLQDTLLGLEPESTAFIICSKSFRTQETLTNALAARAWLATAGASDADIASHFLAITTNLEAAAEFGIPESNCLPLWDWVGGRYSVWSAIGLSTAIAIGWENFQAFLDGAHAMDEHLRNAPAQENLPLWLSLLEIWNCNLLGAGNHVVLPYSHHLQRLPEFLQQLTMESNGKRVSLSGAAVEVDTGPILWGTAGTMGQHSFHQLLHQGTRLCPVDFVLPLRTHTGMIDQHQQLVANCLAQSRTLMVGRSEEEAQQSLLGRGKSASEARDLAPHLSMPGNRPNNLITMESLNPASLGALLALYEHRTYLSGCLWGINPFDQWGVELGKEIGTQILAQLGGDTGSAMDPSTASHMAAWHNARELS